MAYTYSHLYDIQTVGLRFFTVYGPRGRPDMAYFKFTKAILEGKPIEVYNYGKPKRDFTYIADIIQGLVKIIAISSYKKYEILNIGNSKPVSLMNFISILENILKKKALKNFINMQAGDVEETFADITKMEKQFDFKPTTRIDKGLQTFINWYLRYNKYD